MGPGFDQNRWPFGNILKTSSPAGILRRDDKKMKTKTMPPKKKAKREESESRYRQILIELIHLRESDYDLFMQRLYDALSGEFKDMVNDDSPLDEKLKALGTMIEYFAEREEYEKCAELKRMSDELNLA